MNRRLFLTLAACAALLVASPLAFANKVDVDYNHHVDFSQFHTYSWNRVDVTNALNSSRIKRAVNYELQKRGWKEVPSGGQITLNATDHAHNEKEAESYYNGMGDGWGMGWGWGGWGWGPGGGFGDETTTTTDVRLSHLVLDMFDTQTKKLVWRGVSHGELSGNSNRNRGQLYEDLHVMFRYFPPKQKH